MVTITHVMVSPELSFACLKFYLSFLTGRTLRQLMSLINGIKKEIRHTLAKRIGKICSDYSLEIAFFPDWFCFYAQYMDKSALFRSTKFHGHHGRRGRRINPFQGLNLSIFIASVFRSKKSGTSSTIFSINFDSIGVTVGRWHWSLWCLFLMDWRIFDSRVVCAVIDAEIKNRDKLHGHVIGATDARIFLACLGYLWRTIGSQKRIFGLLLVAADDQGFLMSFAFSTFG